MYKLTPASQLEEYIKENKSKFPQIT